MREAIGETGGTAVAVEDADIIKAENLLASTEGAFICPEGAANLHAAIVLKEQGWIKTEERVVLLNTGSGLKYPETVESNPPLLQPGGNIILA